MLDSFIFHLFHPNLYKGGQGLSSNLENYIKVHHELDLNKITSAEITSMLQSYLLVFKSGDLTECIAVVDELIWLFDMNLPNFKEIFLQFPEIFDYLMEIIHGDSINKENSMYFVLLSKISRDINFSRNNTLFNKFLLFLMRNDNGLDQLKLILLNLLPYISRDYRETLSNDFINKIKECIGLSPEIDDIILQIGLKYSLFMVLDRKHLYFIEFIKKLFERTGPENVEYLSIILKNLVQRNSSIMKENWFNNVFTHLLNFRTNNVYKNIMSMCTRLNQQLYDLIFSNSDFINYILEICQSDDEELIIEVMHVLTSTMKTSSYIFYEKFINNCDNICTLLLHYIIEGSIELKLEAGHLFSSILGQTSQVNTYANQIIKNDDNQFKELFFNGVLILINIGDTVCIQELLKGFEALCQYASITGHFIELSESLDSYGIIDAITNLSTNESIVSLSQKIMKDYFDT